MIWCAPCENRVPESHIGLAYLDCVFFWYIRNKEMVSFSFLVMGFIFVWGLVWVTIIHIFKEVHCGNGWNFKFHCSYF